MTISEKVAYLKGLAEGLDLDTAKSKEGKLISVMIGILEEIGMSIEDLEENTVALGEEIDAISDAPAASRNLRWICPTTAAAGTETRMAVAAAVRSTTTTNRTP